MPYKSEASCRLRSPDEFEKNSFRRIQQGKLAIIIGRLKGKDTTSSQAFRYPIDKWDKDEARKHCEEHKGTFHEAG